MEPLDGPLALAGVVIALTGGLLAAWLLPAATRVPERIIAGEPEGRTFHTSTSDARMAESIGPAEGDVRFLGSGTLLATAGPWNPLTFRDLTGARPDWTVEDDSTLKNSQRPGKFAWPYAFSPDGTALAGDIGGTRPLRIWEVPSGRERVAARLDARSIEKLGFSSDGTRLAVGWRGHGATRYECSVGMTMIDAETGAERLVAR